MPSVQLKVSNITRALQTYLEDADGGIGATVNLRIINTMNMASNIPEVEEKFIVNKTTVAYDWVTFDLGGGSILNSRFPSRRILKNNCSFKYKEIECGCTSAYTDCNHTLADCRIRKNSYRFGGEPGIMQGGIYID
jgi:phage-related protein